MNPQANMQATVAPEENPAGLMRNFLLCFCILLLPILCRADDATVRPLHLAALKSLGLPMWLLPETSRLAYRGCRGRYGATTSDRGYTLEYWASTGDVALQLWVTYSATRTGLPEGEPYPKLVASQQVQIPQLGRVRVKRQENPVNKYFPARCETDWIPYANGFLHVRSGDMPLAQFVQTLESLQVRDATQPASPFVAMRATQIPLWQLRPPFPLRTASFDLDASRGFHNYQLTYAVGPGTLSIHGARGGVGSVVFREVVLASANATVPGIKKVPVVRIRDSSGRERVVSEWQQDKGGLVRFEAKGLSLAECIRCLETDLRKVR